MKKNKKHSEFMMTRYIDDHVFVSCMESAKEREIKRSLEA